jgi:hypothetical protein
MYCGYVHKWQCKSKCIYKSGFLCQSETSFKFEPPTTTKKRKAEKELETKTGGSWNSRKDLERGQGNSWKQNSVALLYGGPMLQNVAAGIVLLW